MGSLINGCWVREDSFPTRDGAFAPAEPAFRNEVTAETDGLFPAEAGRYRLYVSLACPWAHRTLIVRALKRLEAAVPVTVVDSLMGPDGWALGDGRRGNSDPELGADFLRDLYVRARSDYTGRVTVPVLWDRESRTIVSNESADIVRMLNRAFDAFGDSAVDLRPPEFIAEIEALNGTLYEAVNNGVYACGFSTSQAAYDRAFDALFAALDSLEARLHARRYLAGERITESDVRLFVTLVRFDAVYFGHFKCNRQQIADYPALSNYLRELYQLPGIAETVSLGDIKDHYYRSHLALNPSGIVPRGPALDFDAPHDRALLPGMSLRSA